MCPQRASPATRIPARNTSRQHHSSAAPRQPTHTPQQLTLWDYFPTTPNLATTLLTPTNDMQPTHVSDSQHELRDANTPTTTPTVIHDTPNTQSTQQTQPIDSNSTHQTRIVPDTSNEPWGDMWAVPTTAMTFRIVSKNTGTVNPNNLDMQAITNELIHLGASVFAAQETNIHWDTLTNYQIYQQCKRTAQQIKLTTASSQEPSSDWYKPGGTLLLTLAPWTSRIVNHGSDPLLGRWTYQEFLGKNDRRVIIVSGYRVCNQKFDAASNTVSAQQIRLLQAHGLSNPNPRKLFLSDLITQIKQWRTDNKEVILCLDANEPIDDPRSDISRIFTETDLIDLHYHRHPALRKPATHQRGSKAIDLIAGSPLVASALLHAWIHPFGDPVMIKGDHRLLGIDLDPEVLFGHADLTLPKQQTRGTNSRHPQKVTKFCKQVIKQCNHYRLAERVADLRQLEQLEPHHYEELEAIDKRLTKILLQADRACTPINPSSWSPELNQAYLRHRMWSLTLTAKRTERDMTDAIAAIRKRLIPSPIDQQEEGRSLSANLRHATKALRAAKKEADALRKQHLEAVLNEARASNKTKKSKALANLIHAEQNQRCFSAF